MDISVVIPAFDEEDSIRHTVEDIKQAFSASGHANRFEIIVVDDASNDLTVERIRGCPGVTILINPERRGYGHALKTGIRSASYDIIAITDGDGSYKVENVDLWIDTLKNNDLVIGKRHYLPNSTSKIRLWARLLLNKIACFWVRQKIGDVNSGLRFFRKSLVINNVHLFPSGFSFTSTSTLVAIYSGLRIAYIPIQYHQRCGRSKMRAYHFFSILYTIIKVTYVFHPMRVLIVFASVLIFCGASLWGFLHV